MDCFSFFFNSRSDPPKDSLNFQMLSEVQNLKLYSYKELRIATDDFHCPNYFNKHHTHHKSPIFNHPLFIKY
ncbi:hypothetical protein Hanom_Chr05g00427481 [Helianthus anomalus]